MAGGRGVIDYFIYWFMQTIGYRKIYFDWAFKRNIRLDQYECWSFDPWMKKGTYREQGEGFKFAGYGVDK
jgi:hypothetical protein